MKVSIRRMGNSQFVIIPTLLLMEAGLDREAENDALVWPGFGNEADADLKW